MDAYLTNENARALAASLGSTLPEDDVILAGRLLRATLDLDSAMAYQGRKYQREQEREFPRIDPRRETFPDLQSSVSIDPLAPSGTIMDWDAATQTAVVPPLILAACVLQAEWLGNAAVQKQLTAIASGLAGQQIGSGSETYGAASPLCPRAMQLLAKYRIRSGELL